MTEKLTKESFRGRKFYFHPASIAEATMIQEHLFALGCAWSTSGKTVGHLDTLPTGTLTVDNGVMTFSESRETGGQPAASTMFDPGYIADDREFMLVQFRKMSERLDRLEKKIDAIQSQLDPPEMDKPVLRHPKP